MIEKQLIRQLKELADIQPRKDWVVLTKRRIFADEEMPEAKHGLVSFFPFFRYKLALAPIISVLVIIGLFGFAQNTVPGDFLFSVKKMTETAQVTFTSEIEKPKVHLELANKRLEELNRIIENNQVRNLDPAIKEFQANIVQATEEIIAMNVNVTTSDSLILKDIVAETQKLEENKQKIEKVLATVIGDTQDLRNAIVLLEEQLTIQLIAGLENQMLTEEDEKLLSEAKEHYEDKVVDVLRGPRRPQPSQLGPWGPRGHYVLCRK